jgi:hypothetical protein
MAVCHGAGDSHEAIIDSVWDTNIRPLLLKRFPKATAEEIKEAHGYAYEFLDRFINEDGIAHQLCRRWRTKVTVCTWQSLNFEELRPLRTKAYL